MRECSSTSEPRVTAYGWALLCALPLTLHVLLPRPVDPVFAGDSNRHVMTSIFFRDMLTDMPTNDPKAYARDYYEQYPALGLLVWPPLFHGITGLAMLIFGTSAWVARSVTLASGLLATACLFRLCRRRMSLDQAGVTAAVFSLLPMTFLYSRHAMLEMPTLGLCLLCIDQFDIWLNFRRRNAKEQIGSINTHGVSSGDAVADNKSLQSRNLYMAAIAAALAALTRFDAVYLLPTLVLMAVFASQWRSLWNKHVLFAALLALALAGPTYAVIWYELGDLHVRQAMSSVGGEQSSFLADGCLTYYPSCLPEQAGGIVTLLGLIGLVHSIGKDRVKAGVFMAMMLGTYVTFTPLAELRARHAIYWLPAVAFFAVSGTIQLIQFIETRILNANARIQLRALLAICAYTVLFTGPCWSTCHLPRFQVSGYAKAATTVLDRTDTNDVVLIDAWWDGNFTYHMRHLDPTRSRAVVRGDQLFYDFISVPEVDFQSFVETDGEILTAIAASGARCIVFEDPQPFGHIPLSEKFRNVVKQNPGAFPPVSAAAAAVQFPNARPFTLRVFDVNQVELYRLIDRVSEAPFFTTPDGE